MSDSDRRSPFQPVLIVLMLAAGGWFFFQHYQVDGLGGFSASRVQDEPQRDALVSYRDERTIRSPSDLGPSPEISASAAAGSPLSSGSATEPASPLAGRPAPSRAQHLPHLRVASWALDGLGPTKLGDEEVRQHLVGVMRQFDVIALQQIASVERDLVPRLADALNEGTMRYDYVLGDPTGPDERPEQLAFVFDTTRLRVDRSQTYVLADPDDQVTYDPLVAWFQAAQPPVSEAWTFSLVNLRIDLARAPSEVDLLAEMLSSVRHDGRGEDDVILSGLFQADDRYLIPIVGGGGMRASVRSTSTDIFGRHQTSNVLVDTDPTSEFIGRGGVFDFLRVYNLSVAQAEAATRHLPVYAEFTAHEGGEL